MNDAASTIDAPPPADEPSFYKFQPRPDQPHRYDQQTGFYESKTPGVAWLVGGNASGTTEVALAKIAKFVLCDQAPPRYDTPFWIISYDYATVMGAAWKEKLRGHGHIPNSEIDWDRVHWYKVNNDWPFSVPLRPWPHDPSKNWRLEFMSYKQGRQRMQAQSIGGFCFIEQFPWGLLEEVLRGCREYSFGGNKFCEFTPVDPNLSIEIEEMIENGPEPQDERERRAGLRYLPPDWEIYRANTQCAKEAGHIDPHWFDEFFSVIPDEMRETRMTGQFAVYEGAIYQTFNPGIHLVGDDVIDFPPNVYHRRGMDWGAGPDNPFVCLWAYRDGLGCYYVYDEYYSADQYKTTIEHLSEVDDRWPWPDNNSYFGTTWADPSGRDEIRIASKLDQYTAGKHKGMSIASASSSVREGIEHVQWLLKPAVRTIDADTGEVLMKPRLFIHKYNCPNLAREMRMYRWLVSRDTGLNPRDARVEPLKKNDHACDALRYLVFSEAVHTQTMPTSMKRVGSPMRHGVYVPPKRR